MIDFEKNMGLVYHIYQKHFKKYLYLKEDLCQEGFLALFKACKLFDTDKGVKFSAYAGRAIYNNMLTYLLKKEQKHYLNNITFSELEEKKVPIENLESTIENNEDMIFLKDLIFNNSIKLTNTNKSIIYSYIFENLSQYQICEKFKISQPQVSRIIKKFKNQIKEGMNVSMR